MARIALILFMLLAPILALAQLNEPGAGFCIDANYLSGKVIKHSPNFKLPIPDHSSAIDLNFQWKTTGSKDWQQRRRYPTVGIGLFYTNYGIDSVYGRLLAIYPNIEIPLLSSTKLQWTLKLGDGAGFVSRKFTRKPPANTLNNAIGSTMNDFAHFSTDVRYRVSSHISLQAGLNFTHISNASYRKPNLGINMYAYHIGIKYYPVTDRVNYVHSSLPTLPNRWLFQARYTMALNQLMAPLGPFYPAYIGTIAASRRWLGKNKMFFGADYSYHTVVKHYLANNVTLNPNNTENTSSSKMAFLVGNEFLLGKVGVLLQAGYYVRKAYLNFGSTYQKLGLNYYLVQREKGGVKEFFICGALKTHLFEAELAEFGLGIGL